MRRWILAAALACSCAGAAFARGTEGLLDLILTPNNGRPAIVAPGDTFEAELAGRAELALLQGSAAHQLEATWIPRPGGAMRALCAVPAGLAPGAYALQATAADRVDVTPRAVFVRAAFPEAYEFAHVSDTHVGSERDGQPAAEILRRVLAALNERDLAFVFITGDLTHEGTPEQFRAFIDSLDTCAHPTFVCPGNHDRTAQNYERFFGPTPNAFRYGPDGFLSFDTKDFIIADEMGAQDADLEILRRAIKPARWSLGLTHRYDPDMGMRAQITLFVDTPLDLLLFGHWHRENKPGEKTVLFGTTPMVATPAGVDGSFRLIGMGAGRPQPRPVQSVTPAK